VLQVNANKDLPMAVIAKRFFAKDKVRLTYRRGTRAMKPKTDPYHRLLFREVDLFIVVSKFIHDNTLQVYKVPESRVLCIHNGVDPDFFGTKSGGKASLRQELGIPEEAFVFGQVANYGTGKCPDVFLKGAERLVLQQAQALPVFFCWPAKGPRTTGVSSIVSLKT